MRFDTKMRIGLIRCDCGTIFAPGISGEDGMCDSCIDIDDDRQEQEQGARCQQPQEKTGER